MHCSAAGERPRTEGRRRRHRKASIDNVEPRSGRPQAARSGGAAYLPRAEAVAVELDQASHRAARRRAARARGRPRRIDRGRFLDPDLEAELASDNTPIAPILQGANRSTTRRASGKTWPPRRLLAAGSAPMLRPSAVHVPRPGAQRPDAERGNGIATEARSSRSDPSPQDLLVGSTWNFAARLRRSPRRQDEQAHRAGETGRPETGGPELHGNTHGQQRPPRTAAETSIKQRARESPAGHRQERAPTGPLSALFQRAFSLLEHCFPTLKPHSPPPPTASLLRSPAASRGRPHRNANISCPGGPREGVAPRGQSRHARVPRERQSCVMLRVVLRAICPSRRTTTAVGT